MRNVRAELTTSLLALTLDHLLPVASRKTRRLTAGLLLLPFIRRPRNSSVFPMASRGRVTGDSPRFLADDASSYWARYHLTGGKILEAR